MPTPTIDLECPSCKTLLELDAGFAGGVCRCSNCGTLMTVPGRAGGLAERLTRPAAPGQPAPTSTTRPTRPSRPDRPGALTPSPDSEAANASDPETPRRTSSRSRPTSRRSSRKSAKARKTDKPSKTRKPIASPEELPDEEVVYQTDSGKTIRINARRVPTAKLRKTVRYTTGTVVILFLVAVVAGVITFGIVLLSSANRAVDLDQAGEVVQLEEAFAYDPRVNPLSLQQPNALGSPLREHTAVVLDLSAEAADQFPALQRLLTAGLANHDSPKRLSLIAATPNGPTLAVDNTELDDLSSDQLTASLNPHTPPSTGDAELAAAARLALDQQPDLILLVVSQWPSRAAADALTQALGSSDTTADVIMVGSDSVALQDFQSDRGHRYTQLRRSQLQDWIDTPPE